MISFILSYSYFYIITILNKNISKILLYVNEKI